MAPPARLSIGRGPGNDIVVDHPSVSRKHAEMLRNADGSFDIFDDTSSVGTFALHQGRWVQFEHATVGPDETIRLGEFETTANMLLSAYRDPFDRTTERGPKVIETRREAERRLDDEPAGTPNPQPPPGALNAEAFRPPESSRPPSRPRPEKAPAPPPAVAEAPPMPAAAAEPPAPSAAPAPGPYAGKAPSLLVAYLLWFFLGVLGVHRFYLRSYLAGVAQAVLFVAGVGLILGLAMADLQTAGILSGTVPLTLLGLWWMVDGFLTFDMVKKRGGA